MFGWLNKKSSSGTGSKGASPSNSARNSPRGSPRGSKPTSVTTGRVSSYGSGNTTGYGSKTSPAVGRVGGGYASASPTTRRLSPNAKAQTSHARSNSFGGGYGSATKPATTGSTGYGQHPSPAYGSSSGYGNNNNNNDNNLGKGSPRHSPPFGSTNSGYGATSTGYGSNTNNNNNNNNNNTGYQSGYNSNNTTANPGYGSNPNNTGYGNAGYGSQNQPGGYASTPTSRGYASTPTNRGYASTPSGRNSPGFGHMVSKAQLSSVVDDKGQMKLEVDHHLPVEVQLGANKLTLDRGNWGLATRELEVTRERMRKLEEELEHARRQLNRGNDAQSVDMRRLQQLEDENLQLRQENHLLQYKNKALVAMCTVSECDLRALCAEAGVPLEP